MLAVVLAVVLLGVAAVPAGAGTLTVTANQANCGIFKVKVVGGPGFLYTPPPCSGRQMELQGAGPNKGNYLAYEADAPAGITINSAYTNVTGIGGVNNNQDWYGGSYWNAGGLHGWTAGQTYESDSNFNSPYWGFDIVCERSPYCSNLGAIFVGSVTLTATETQGPGLYAVGSSNLWYQAGHYVWNPPGDPWSIALLAWDPSGVCSTSASVGTSQLNGPSATPNMSAWQQCPNQYWDQAHGASVDTRSYVPTTGSLAFQLSASNAAGVPSTVSETLQIDNDPVGVSLSDLNDPNPGAWVGHAVAVKAGVSAGPSGVGGLVCAVDGAPNQSYPASGMTIDGDGAHTIKCTGWNRAVNPQGSPQFASAAQTIHIDETPPTVAFEMQNPSDPTRLIADTGDSESGVTGGTIQIAPSGSTNWTNLPTSFDGQHLIARINDAGLRGGYILRAISCDNVANCASTQETLTLPLRIAARSVVGFVKIHAPAKVVRERVLVGWHYKRVRRHRRLVRLRTGGHYIRVRLVIRPNAACAYKRVRTGRRRWRELRACRQIKITTRTSERVAYGKRATIDGLLISAQGVPIAGALVALYTAPTNGLGQFHLTATVITAPNGEWSATLAHGPSRIIRAVYGGSASLLPASGQARLDVPARIRFSVSPRGVSWTQTITIRGQLKGGYIPPDGVALRLLIGYPGSHGVPVLAFRTNPRGAFVIRWGYHGGQGIASYPLWIATTASESDYPWAPSSSPAITVTFGRRSTPEAPRRRAHHRARKHAAHKRKTRSR